MTKSTTLSVGVGSFTLFRVKVWFHLCGWNGTKRTWRESWEKCWDDEFDKYEDEEYDEKWEIDHLLLSLASVSLHFYSCSSRQLVHLDVEVDHHHKYQQSILTNTLEVKDVTFKIDCFFLHTSLTSSITAAAGILTLFSSLRLFLTGGPGTGIGTAGNYAWFSKIWKKDFSHILKYCHLGEKEVVLAWLSSLLVPELTLWPRGDWVLFVGPGQHHSE